MAPEKHQPSGTANFSMLNTVDLRLTYNLAITDEIERLENIFLLFNKYFSNKTINNLILKLKRIRFSPEEYIFQVYKENQEINKIIFLKGKHCRSGTLYILHRRR